MRRPEDLEMVPGKRGEEDGPYPTSFHHHTQKKNGDAGEAAKNTHGCSILILLVLLIFMLIGLGILTGFLFISNMNMREDISQMHDSLSIKIQNVIGAVKDMQDIQKESSSNVMSKVRDMETSLNSISKELTGIQQKISSTVGLFLSRPKRSLSGDELNDGLKASSLSVRRTYPDMD